MNVIRSIIKPRMCQKIIKRWTNDIYEPPYLAEMVSKIPIYETLNIYLRGYDFAVLENYQKFVHKLLKNMEVEVEDCWVMPPQALSVKTFKPKSEVMETQYNLKLYERVVQVVDVTTVELPTIIRAIEGSLPPGVKLQIRHHEDIDEENRYVPDKELNSLKEELDSLGGPIKKK